MGMLTLRLQRYLLSSTVKRATFPSLRGGRRSNEATATLRANSESACHDVGSSRRHVASLALSSIAASLMIVSCINRKPCYALGGGGSKADQPFTPGQGVGEGLKGELWKAKRPNVSILEIEEGSPVLGLLSLVRNVETVGSEFVCASNRLLRQLLEVAVMELPNDEEAIFNTPAGIAFQGVLPEDDLEICAVSLTLEGEQPGVFDSALDLVLPSAKRGVVSVKGLTHASKVELPLGIRKKHVLLLVPVVGYAEPVLTALEALEEAGVKEEDVILLSVVISKEACEKLTKEAKDMLVITAAMDPFTRVKDHQVIPGVGDFSARYFAAAPQGEGQSSGIGGKSESSKTEKKAKRWWLLWLL